MYRQLICLVVSLVLLTNLGSSALATPTVGWDNGGSDSFWSTNENWFSIHDYPDNTTPDSNTFVIISMAGTNAPLIDSGVGATAYDLLILGDGRMGTIGHLYMTGGILVATNSINIGDDGTFTMGGGTVNCNGDLVISGAEGFGENGGRINLYGGIIIVNSGFEFSELGSTNISMDITKGTLLAISSESSVSYIEDLIAADFITGYGSTDDNDLIVVTVDIEGTDYTSVTAVTPPPLLVPSQYPTIQAAINDCNSGNIVIVADGTLTGEGNRNIDFFGKAITVKSENGPENCIIDCQNLGRGFYFHNGERGLSVLDGFTITNGDSDKGGGIYCENSSPTINKCIIRNNSTSWAGGGIYCRNSNANIASCIVSGNSGSRGGGIYSFDDSKPNITDCLISGNSASNYGGGISADGAFATITNCTFSDNTAGRGGAIDLISSTVTISNCILWGDSPSEIAHTATGHAIVTFCDVEDGWAGEGNINVNPLFASDTDYRLVFGSPCIDKGTNSPSGGLPTTDLDGITRPFDGDYDSNSVADMGAYEFHQNPGNPVLSLTPASFRFTCPVGGPNPESKTLSLWNAGGGLLQWQVTEDSDWLVVTPLSGDSSSEVDEVFVSVDANGLISDKYDYVFTVFDPCDSNNTRFVPVTFRVGPTLYIPAEYSTIQAAIDAAFDGDEIIAADGTYTGSGNRDINFHGKAIIVRSANGPENCIIDCNGTKTVAHRGFYFDSSEDEDSILEGFTITNGYYDTGALPEGGGILCLYASTNPTIRNCIITGNKAWSGGGISCYRSSAKIVNCTITNNNAYYDKGGGILCWDNSNATITGCTISNNEAKEYGGGVYFYGGSPVLTNSIVWGNTVNSSPQQIKTAASSNLSVNYCDIQGGWSGTENKNINPLFVDDANGDYHLEPNSSCIDAGDPNYSPYPKEWDIDGELRVMGNSIDIGSDEVSDMLADFDDDGTIDNNDLDPLSQTWLVTSGQGGWDERCDLNGNGSVDLIDYTLFAKDWLKESDTESPTVVHNLTVSGVTNTTISLDWEASMDNVGAVGYKIYRDGSYAGWTASSGFTDSGLDANTIYTYMVSAYDAAYNESSLSVPCQAYTTE